jgi:hypothetical protein
MQTVGLRLMNPEQAPNLASSQLAAQFPRVSRLRRSPAWSAISVQRRPKPSTASRSVLWSPAALKSWTTCSPSGTPMLSYSVGYSVTKGHDFRRVVMAFYLVGATRFELVTSSVSGKRSPTELSARGGSGNRTRVQGFAGPCLSHSAIPPNESPRAELAAGTEEPCGPSARGDGVRHLRADDGIRTRDPHLGKVMLYQLSHVRTRRAAPACVSEL